MSGLKNAANDELAAISEIISSAYNRTQATTTVGGTSTDADYLFTGFKWSPTDLTFSFPSSAETLGYDNQGYSVVGFDEGLKAASRAALSQFSDVSGLSFREIADSPDGIGSIRFAKSNVVSGSTLGLGFYPASQNGNAAGDTFYREDLSSAPIGSQWFKVLMHEIGHAVGLKHTFSSYNGFGSISPRELQDRSVMSYHFFDDGYDAQSLMRLDISAVQQLYGANYNYNSGDNTYTFSADTGEMFIDGAGQGAASRNVIYRTIWDGGGTDTFDLSNYSTNLSIDLNPGGISNFNSSQIAYDLSGSAMVGNVFMSWLYGSNTASIIENATGGSGSDTITGNSADNCLIGNAGADTLNGGTGSDTLYGGSGNNTLNGGAGDDCSVFNFARSSTTAISATSVTTSSQSETISSIEGMAFLEVNHTGSFKAGQAYYQDINGDNTVDLIFQTDNLGFYLSPGASSGMPITALAFQHGGTPLFIRRQMQFSDINGDGQSDAIWQGNDNQFWVNYGSAGGFTGASKVAMHGGEFNPYKVQYADVTGDGGKDLMYHGDDNRFWLSASNGSAFGNPIHSASHGGPTNFDAVQYADVDGDGKEDMIYHGVDNRFWVTLSQGTKFGGASLANQHGGDFVTTKVQYADINGDGKADMIYQGDDNRFWVANSNGTKFLGNTMAAAVSHDSFNTDAVSFVDMNGDGKADMMYQGAGNDFWYYESQGSTFKTGVKVIDFAGSFVEGSAGYGDINGDGLGDIMFQDANNNFYISLSSNDWVTTLDARETESNNTIATADTLSEGVTLRGKLSAGSSTEVDYYSFSLSQNAVITLSFTDIDTYSVLGTDSIAYDVALLDPSGNQLVSSSINTTGSLNYTATTNGTYYVAVQSSSSSTYDDGDYQFSVSTGPISARETEPNNSLATADTIGSGWQITGQLSSGYGYEKDYYALSVSSSGTISVAFADTDTSYTTYSHVVGIFDSSGNTLSSDTFTNAGTVTAAVASSGTYYVGVYSDGYSYTDTDDYTITATFS